MIKITHVKTFHSYIKLGTYKNNVNGSIKYCIYVAIDTVLGGQLACATIERKNIGIIVKVLYEKTLKEMRELLQDGLYPDIKRTVYYTSKSICAGIVNTEPNIKTMIKAWDVSNAIEVA